jgi:SsrA-binding protein
LRTRTAATGGARLNVGNSTGLGFAGLGFAAVGFLTCLGLAFAVICVDGLGAVVERGATAVALGARYVGVGAERADARGATGVRAGFGFGGAGSGAGTVALGTVVGGTSAPRALATPMRPKPTATAASIAATAKVLVRPDKLSSSLEARRRSDCKLRSGRPTPAPRLDGMAPKGEHLIVDNRRARHDYHLLERVEAGLVLTGTEVKSLRDGRASLQQAYADVRDGEAWLVGAHISVYDQGNVANHDPDRDRKLLLHRNEVDSLAGKVAQKGLTLVPTKLYFKNGRAKVELALARGKEGRDKRRDIAKREADRDMQRALKARR